MSLSIYRLKIERNGRIYACEHIAVAAPIKCWDLDALTRSLNQKRRADPAIQETLLNARVPHAQDLV